MSWKSVATRAAAFAVIAGLAGPAAAATCGGDFNAWMNDFRREAAAAGISARAVAALDGVRFDPSIIKKDRAQGVFSQTFLEFSDRMVSSYRLQQGAKLIKQHADTFRRIERQYGVPAPVIVGFWGLETDFGANVGDSDTLRALASLAFDCRRPDHFRPQLLDALRLIDRGDLPAKGLVGAWAGELGQVQFLPSDYYRSGVDYDGDGRVDLLRSVPDVLASAAALLVHHGWKAGQPWLEEVRVPENLPWEQASIYVQHPRSQWAGLGVTKADGSPLESDRLPASLVLPMGRNGPAFLAFDNFQVYLQWNQSSVYATTAAYFATRLAGAKKVSRGRAEIASLNRNQIIELQRLLIARGYDVGNADGIIGARTRDAVKELQQQLGLPADSYPTAEFLARLRGN